MADGEESLYPLDKLLVILTDQARVPRVPRKLGIHEEQLLLYLDSLQARFSFE